MQNKMPLRVQGPKYTPGTKVSTRGGLPTSLQYRGEAKRAEVSFYMASVAE